MTAKKKTGTTVAVHRVVPTAKPAPKKPAAPRSRARTSNKPAKDIPMEHDVLGYGTESIEEGVDMVALRGAVALTANLAPHLAVFQLEIEYRHRADDSNPINTLIKRNAQESMAHTVVLSLVVEDLSAYPVAAELGNDAGGIIESAGISLGNNVKYFINKAIDQFHAAANHKVSVSRVVVQPITLPGIAIII